MTCMTYPVVHPDILPQGEVEPPRVRSGLNQGLCGCNAGLALTEQHQGGVGKHALDGGPQVHSSPLHSHVTQSQMQSQIQSRHVNAPGITSHQAFKKPTRQFTTLSTQLQDQQRCSLRQSVKT